VGVTKPGRHAIFAWPAAAVNPEFQGKTGRNPPPCAARGGVRLGSLLIRFPILFNSTQRGCCGTFETVAGFPV